MCTTTDSGSSGSNASLVISVISRRFESKFEPVTPVCHISTKLVVGTSSILPAYVLNAYFPGINGSRQTPLQPVSTSSPCEYSAPDTSSPLRPVYDTTTPTKPTGITVLLINSTVANRRLM